ncbi:hypothetical protein CLIB1423_11S04214 [[Candida] railenensis]|uniref:Uncharacterized protein n=1 Tax=[Candida] railenensis TaxID=45579 RepID=A0A9P0VZ62_9ASCO|nr:hypothetical protein CLIB1423_11S04214 [[Candida] railenensis]
MLVNNILKRARLKGLESYAFFQQTRKYKNLSPRNEKTNVRQRQPNSVKSQVKVPLLKGHQVLTQLKYDPENNDNPNGFHGFGILPFIQDKLNKYLLPRMHKMLSVPNFNVSPTFAQRIILTVLNSDHSVIYRSNNINQGADGNEEVEGSSTKNSEGKSLAIAAYALNLSLSRFPNFGVLSRHHSAFNSIDSIIVVPTSRLVEKYQEFMEILTQDMPLDCCPDRFIDDQSGFTRRPLKVEFFSKSKASVVLTTKSSQGPEDNILKTNVKRAPHVLVTTPSGLYDIMNGEKTGTLATRHNLSEVKFFAVDDMNYMINCTDIDPNLENITTYGQKGKYAPKLERIIKNLQDLQIEKYNINLKSRLDSIEKNFRRQSEESDGINEMENDHFGYSNHVFEDNSLSTSTVGDTDGRNTALLKKLIKAKRQVLYKPIQYCFVTEAENSMHQVLRKLNQRNQMDDILNNISTQVEQMVTAPPQRGSDTNLTNLQQNYVEYLSEKGHSVQKKNSDPQIEYIEKLIRFDDTKRFYRNQERKILSVGSFNIKKEQTPVKVSFSTYSKKGVFKGIDIISQHPPTSSDSIRVFLENVKTTKQNLENYQKQYLKQKTSQYLAKPLKKQNVLIKKAIKGTIKQFREENPSNKKPFLLVVPSFFQFPSKYPYKVGKDRFILHSDIDRKKVPNFFIDQGPKEGLISNMIVTASDLVGMEIHDTSNIAIFGIEGLVPQLAMTKSWKNPGILKYISGVEDPMADLFYFYLSKLSSSNDKDKNMIINMMDGDLLDMQKLSEVILYNKILEHVDVTRVVPESNPTILQYGLTPDHIEYNSKLVQASTRPASKKLSTE